MLSHILSLQEKVLVRVVVCREVDIEQRSHKEKKKTKVKLAKEFVSTLFHNGD